MHTGVFSDIDLDAPGRQFGFLGLPVSVDRSPYFQVKVPVCRIRNGDGPRVLLMAGNHGDEYEGELALARLVRRLDPAAIRGTVTILPMTNAPAVRAARRCSPIDGGNLNRAFPGDPAGAPTWRLAHFLEREMLSRHDVMLDLHSGGTSMAHLPCSLIERQADAGRQQRSLDLMRALGLPYGFVADNGPAAPTSMAAAARAGALAVSGEFGGGGTVTPETMRIAETAIDRLLLALGSVEAPVLRPDEPRRPDRPTQVLALDRIAQSHYATRPGWFEPAVPLGTPVRAGDLAGWLHDLDRLEEPEEALRFAEDGIVISQRLHTHAEPGDCLVQVARPVEMP